MMKKKITGKNYMRETKLNLFKKIYSEGRCSNISATLDWPLPPQTTPP
jgi:hypothetical protein